MALMEMSATTARENSNWHRLVGGSFMSATRVASSPTELTLDMFITNQEYLDQALGQFIDSLSKLRLLLRSNNESALRELVEAARRDIR
jgi:prephenate dehydrogenase